MTSDELDESDEIEGEPSGREKSSGSSSSGIYVEFFVRFREQLRNFVFQEKLFQEDSRQGKQ